MDTDYGGENPDGIVTAWIALTPSRHANGALWFAPCSHRRAAADAMTEDFHHAAQAYLPPVQVRLSPGEASFHHGRLLHSSGANQTDSPRVGLAIRFFGSRLAPEVAQCGEPYFVSDSREEKQKVMEKAPFPFTWWSSSAKHGES